MCRWGSGLLILLALGDGRLSAAEPGPPVFSRHVVPVFSRLGCNAGTCHGAVQGKNGFRLSLFGAQPLKDHETIVRDHGGRRIDLQEPDRSLLLRKAAGTVPHGGGSRTKLGSPEYALLRDWIAAGAAVDDVERSRVARLDVTPREKDARAGESYSLTARATFADGSAEDVTALCSFSCLDSSVAAVDASGRVEARGVGDAAIIARFRAEPVMAQVLVAREGASAAMPAEPFNFVDGHVLAKLKRLNVPPAEIADDATFLRRVRLDVTGQLPSPDEVREFLSDQSPDKRIRKIDQLLADPGYAAVWTLKFCDLLKASDFGVYADGLAEHYEAPRFQAWIRARFEENLPYDEFAARILGATSRDGKSIEDWAKDVVALQEGYATPRTDLEQYAARKSLDIYWQRKDAVGVAGTLQVAHAFLGLRLECAQCHRHPHDVWQQDDLLSFANFFMGVRTVGFRDGNEKRYPEEHKFFKQYETEGKQLTEAAQNLRKGRGKELADKARAAEAEVNKLKNEIYRDEQQIAQRDAQASNFRAAAAQNVNEAARLLAQADESTKEADKARAAVKEKREKLVPLQQVVAENEALQQEIIRKERRGRMLMDEIPKRILHAQILHRPADDKAQRFASVTSPLGKQASESFRLLGETQALPLPAEEDPRPKVIEWLRRPDNPYFARAIVNRVWAHYFGRGIVDPPDDLSPYNPATHPQLLDELCRRLIDNRYDLKWLHRTILGSRTYQQSSLATAANAMDRSNYAYFHARRLPAEVLVDALNQATGTREEFDMQYYHWPRAMRTVELPFMPQNKFVVFMLEQFGRPPRNSSSQCDCARQSDSSLLQVLSFANHPRVRQKVADPSGRVALVQKSAGDLREQVGELYLGALSRLPDDAELSACVRYIGESPSPKEGLEGVLWSLLNTKEFVLQH